MKKNRTKESRDQALGEEAVVTVQVPLPLATALGEVERHFFELCVHAGRQVLDGMMEDDRTRLCGPKWSKNPERQVLRAGTTRSEVTLGGRRMEIRRPRARSVEGTEAVLPSFRWAGQRDPLDRRTMEAMAIGVSTRKYARHLEPLPAGIEERSTTKSSVSRRFVAHSTAKLDEWLNRPLGELDLLAVMIDGIHFAERCVLIALGVDREGRKHVLGVHEGNTENATVARTLLTALVDRGLDSNRALLFVIDGSRALARAIKDHWGERAAIQRCQVHKRRNVAEHLPEQARGRVMAEMNKAYETPSASEAKSRLERLARSIEREHPGAAASLREGLDETLTLQQLGIRGALYKTLRTTNPIENLNGSIATYLRNVKRWRDGMMVVRWVGAALNEAHKSFRRVRGFSEAPKLARALDRHAQPLDKEDRSAA
jgi:transposase-like protein